jgi:peptidyl-prolyl cis-trans isomerase C
MDPIFVNGVEIPPRAIAAEMQHHPAPSGAQAWREAACALVIRDLLLQEAARLELDAIANASGQSTHEEALIQALLAHEVTTPEANEETCRRYWLANQAKYRTPDVYEAAHILFPAAMDDARRREAAKQRASDTLVLLAAEPGRFAALARERSACPSAASGGLLGQLRRGDLVPEIETFIAALAPSQICPIPVATRYGYHVLRLDRFARGTVLPYEIAAPFIAREIKARSWQRAVSQYLRVLAGRAEIDGIAIDAAATPLVR